MDTTFRAELFEWRGPTPHHWLPLPPEVCDRLRAEAAHASYGWGAVTVRVRIGATEWESTMLSWA